MQVVLAFRVGRGTSPVRSRPGILPRLNRGERLGGNPGILPGDVPGLGMPAGLQIMAGPRHRGVRGTAMVPAEARGVVEISGPMMRRRVVGRAAWMMVSGRECFRRRGEGIRV